MNTPRSSITLLRATVLVLGLTVAGASTTAAAVASDDGTTTPTSASADPTASASPSGSASTGAATDVAEPTPTPTQGTTPSTTPGAPATQPQAQSVPAIPSFCSVRAPGTSTPADTTYFNYPYGGGAARDTIRSMVLRAISSTPGCDNVNATTGTYTRNLIQVAAYAINDDATVDALIKAVQRGVVVQAISDSHVISGSDLAQRSPSYRRLIRTLNYNRNDASFAKVCSRSCRGSAGNHHYKMYTFTQTGSKRFVTMAGSANLTMKAARGQWNHLDVYTNRSTYDRYRAMFSELAADRPAKGMYRDYLTDAVRTWFFPRVGTKAYNDPMMRGANSLSNIACRNSGVGNGRTIVRIGMYAWYESRGLWIAQKVRQLWNAGCDVAIEYAVMGNTVKRVLYSPAGRGRIPMRQVATYYRDGTVANYDHQKYVTVLGRYNGRSGRAVTWTGTTNWSNLGLYSDDLTQVWGGGSANTATGNARAALYRGAFYRVWRGPHTRVPSPTSKLPGTLGKGDLALGTGKYRNLENN